VDPKVRDIDEVQYLNVPVHCVNSRQYATTKGHQKFQGPWRVQKPVVLDIFQNNTWHNGLCPEPLIFAEASQVEGALSRGERCWTAEQAVHFWELTRSQCVLSLG